MSADAAVDREARLEVARSLRETASLLRRQSEDLFSRARVLEGGLQVLKGREITDAIAAQVTPGFTAHYSVMVETLMEMGLRPYGIEPTLTALTRDERFVQDAPRSGLYRYVGPTGSSPG